MMLQIVLEVAGTVCDADSSIFSQTVDRQPPPTATDRSLASVDLLRTVKLRSVRML